MMIDVVLEESDLVLDSHFCERLVEQQIAGNIEGNQIPQTTTFGRGIFQMPHIKVESASIQKKTAVARRFFVVPIVQVDSADMTLPEEIVLNLDRPGVRLALGLVLGD